MRLLGSRAQCFQGGRMLRRLSAGACRNPRRVWSQAGVVGAKGRASRGLSRGLATGAAAAPGSVTAGTTDQSAYQGVNDVRAVRGMRDMMPPESRQMAELRKQAIDAVELAGYEPVATPLLEQIEVFTHALGAASDVVSKEMYTLQDRRGSTLCLRPENTAGLARAFGSSGLSQVHELPQRFYYHGPMFRYERPQRGRYRQFEQFGVERFDLASADPDDRSSVGRDVEVITMAAHFLHNLGVLGTVELQLNFLGDAAARRNFSAAMASYLEPKREQLSLISQERLDRGSVLRILDSKSPLDLGLLAGRAAPVLSDYISDAARCRADATVDALTSVLAELTVQASEPLKVSVNPRLVRGLDYYTDTVFEFVPRLDNVAHADPGGLGAQGTVLAGGSYGTLVASLGGKDGIVGTGWSAGLDRLALLVDQAYPERSQGFQTKPPHVAILPMNTDAELDSMRLGQRLRTHSVASVCYGTQGPLGKRLKRAVACGASHAVFVEEPKPGTPFTVNVKELASGKQVEVPVDEFELLVKRFERPAGNSASYP